MPVAHGLVWQRIRLNNNCLRDQCGHYPTNEGADHTTYRDLLYNRWGLETVERCDFLFFGEYGVPWQLHSVGYFQPIEAHHGHIVRQTRRVRRWVTLSRNLTALLRTEEASALTVKTVTFETSLVRRKSRLVTVNVSRSSSHNIALDQRQVTPTPYDDGR